MHKKTSPAELWVLFGLLLYKAALDLAYYIFVVPQFSYAKFRWAPTFYGVALGTVLLVVLFFVLPRDSAPSSSVLQIHFVLLFIPLVSYGTLAGASLEFLWMCLFVFFLECVLLRFLPNLRIRPIQHANVLFWVLVGAITVAVYSVMLLRNGIHLSAFRLDETYAIRSGLTYPLGMGYLVPWQGKVINPFLMALGYKKKTPVLLVGALALQLLLFLITAQKAIILIPFAILAVMWFMKRFSLLPALAVTLPLGVSAALLLWKGTGNMLAPSLFVRRLFTLPAQLKFFWYEFFLENPKLGYSQGSIGSVFQLSNPYPKDAAKVIGEAMYQKPEMHANAGYVADAYANGGFFNMVVIALLLVVLLVLLNSLGRKMGNDFVVGLSMFHIISLNDGGLVTSLFTGGLLLLLLLLYLYSSGESNLLQKPPEKEKASWRNAGP
ncbi:hypothetical protein ABB02_01880 [Clostridiaceae bacterium JG1575]|nr:hypothetical protein ABB02_01880 [Clostridiaceae bacterium JG1575]